MTDEKQVTLHGFPVEVGDRVWLIQYGWATVEEVKDGKYNRVILKTDKPVGNTNRIPWEIRTNEMCMFWQPVEITPPPKPKTEIDWSKVSHHHDDCRFHETSLL